MKHRMFRFLCIGVLLLGALSLRAYAAGDTFSFSEFFITNHEIYAISPGATEEMFIVNDTSGMKQNTIRVVYIDTKMENLEIKAGYRDYDGSQWGMQQCTRQAEKAQEFLRKTDPEAEVVAAVNANFFNMTTGEPQGALVMEGKVIHATQSGSAYFAVKSDGTPLIREGSSSITRSIVTAMGGDAVLVNNGEAQTFENTELGPRTAVGIRQDGTVLLVQIDGRQSPMACGVSRQQLAQIMVDLGCDKALNLDGGGSSTFCTKREGEELSIKNSTSDGYERSISGSLLVVCRERIPEEPMPPLHKHSWSVVWNDEVRCDTCSKTQKLGELTGIVKDAAGRSYCYINGTKKTGWIMWGDLFLHAGEDGVLHETEAVERRTCTANGNIKATCKTCGSTYRSSSRYPAGHIWDENHVCTVCGKEGVNLADAVISNVSARYVYKGKAVRPTPVVKVGSTQLTVRSSLYGGDGFLNWVNSDDIGVATVEVLARGKYYGSICKSYLVVPDLVNNLSVRAVTDHEAVLAWDEVVGADQYVICVNQADGSQREVLVTPERQTTACISDLAADQDYTFTVRARATRKGVAYESYQDSQITVHTNTETSSPDVRPRSILDGLSVVLPGGEVLLPQTAAEQTFFFLPGCADLTDLTFVSSTPTLEVQGPLGSQKLTEGESLDLTAITERNQSGMYPLRLIASDGARASINLMRSSITAVFFHDAEENDAVSSSARVPVSVRVIAASGKIRCDGGAAQLCARDPGAKKQSYDLYLDEGADLTNISEKVSHWFVNAGTDDPSLLQDRDYQQLAYEQMLSYTPRTEWADLYRNGLYQGTYQLSEVIEAADTSVKLTEGKLICLCGELRENETGFVTSRGKAFRVLWPENIGESELDEIKDSFQAMEDEVYDPQSDLSQIDLQSLSEAYLFAELSAGDDAFRNGLHFYQNKNGKWVAGPMQRNGASFGCGRFTDTTRPYCQNAYLIRPLLQRTEFRECLEDTLRRLFLPAANRMIGETGKTLAYGRKILYSGAMNEMIWPEQALKDSAAIMDRWITERLNHLFDIVRAEAPQGPDPHDPTPDDPDPDDPNPDDPNPDDPKPDDPNPDIPEPQPTDPINPDPTGTLDPQPTTDPNPQPTTQPEDPAPGEIDYQRLDNLIQQAETIEPDRYTADSYQKLLMTLNLAVEARNLAESQKSVDEAADILELAIRSLIKTNPEPLIPDPTKPEDVPEPCSGGADCPGRVFFDMPPAGNWAHDPIDWAIVHHITAGTSQTMFSPDRGCTRAQVVTFLWRWAGEPAASSTPQFTDVPESAYYAKAVAWAVEQGITVGVAKDRFAPNTTCTRGQIVTFLWRLQDCPKPESENMQFTDVRPEAYYAKAISWAVEQEITQGVGNQQFAPEHTCTRAQIVTFLYRCTKES